jgi:hypothetical protein
VLRDPAITAGIGLWGAIQSVAPSFGMELRWLEVGQRGLKETPEYRNIMLRADRHALWLAGFLRLISPNAALPPSSKETEPMSTLGTCQEAA